MSIIIKEIKAYCQNPQKAENILLENKAKFKGSDHQIDTYFNVNNGRLKLREGDIETYLIQYDRKEEKNVKSSSVKLFKSNDNLDELKAILSASLGIKVVVDKMRKIFFINNVKFHIDQIEGLGSFVEIEAIGEQGKSDEEDLLNQCKYYIDMLAIDSDKLIDQSYSDMILDQQKLTQ